MTGTENMSEPTTNESETRGGSCVVSFWVDGEPKGQPRPRAFARNFGGKWQARVYDSHTAEGWKSQIALTWKSSSRGDCRFEGPVRLRIEFNVPRPKSHFKKGELRHDRPAFVVKKPDVDNYAKAVMDALTQLGVWGDDSQVTTLEATKRFADGRPGALIEIQEDK